MQQRRFVSSWAPVVLLLGASLTNVRCADSGPDETTDRPIVLGGALDDAGGDKALGTVNAQSQSSASEQPTEVCDGLDNDGNGLVDEGTDGAECTIEGKKGTGRTKCVDGQPICATCTPGQERTASCGCNEERTDSCLTDGTWKEGTCDGCTKKVSCEGCVPGEQIVRRCDGCADGTDCGSACIGSTWECTEDCKWKQITDCKAMSPTCSGDMSVNEPCGNCGTRHKTCDGCFWTSDLCMDQGSCKPGDRLTTPCFDKGCAEGMYNSTYCSNECKWVKSPQCAGCKPGVTKVTKDCVRGHRACGQYVIEQTCTLDGEIEICGGERKLPVGHLTTKYLSHCPPIQCTPGYPKKEPCTVAGGGSGLRTTPCQDDCTWGPPSDCDPGGSTCPTSQQCEPNKTETQTKSCGKNKCGKTYEEKRACSASGCGWQILSTTIAGCPECASGQTQNVYCKTPAGECGTLKVRCKDDCTWEDRPTPGLTSADCVANPTSCTPGSTKTDYASCGANTCGKTYPRTYKCMSTGCGWQFGSEDRSVCPPCTPGETETTQQECKPGFPSAGYVQRKCNADTCQWQTLPCPAS